MPELVSVSAVLIAAGMATRRPLRSASAVSAEGQFARAQVTEVLGSLDSAVSLQGPHTALLDELDSLLTEHSTPGWDGHEAPAISYATVQNARDFIRSLPASVPSPELAVDPDDAAISFEWHGGFRKVFSVSVGKSGRLACAGLDGTDRWHAALAFDGERLPEFIEHGIRRATP